ncbi:hypothetical protein SISNIDRAFT_486260 [Sistotremastrum niveocremeum HHB9708]|uniref:Cupin type-2 domain-containing protein n=1 Tax=Sistotremastrum niveocremeum HHB9708 TaxID=1314777 RepID=A0A164TYN6_9AGAM|nr:hypothetical protein SISNIDRAFT_486260 [Sistotremastrum niveocremeum HHB9708]
MQDANSDRPANIVNILNADDGKESAGIYTYQVGKGVGLEGDLGATFVVLKPGTRFSPPYARESCDELIFCLAGEGLVWQDGQTYTLSPGDCGGWKSGTGISHTLINDSNGYGQEGSDLLIFLVYETRPEVTEAIYWPFGPPESPEGRSVANQWSNPPPRGDIDMHPALPRKPLSGEPVDVPHPRLEYRATNIVNGPDSTDSVGQGELAAEATSLSQETSLSGRFGCNLEILAPGCRSSDPHAHSLEDELVYVISGRGLLWMNGIVYDIGPGDAIGFPAGTGIAHTIINDSSEEDGEDLALLVVGQNKRDEGDLVYYPLHKEKMFTFVRWWFDAPQHDLGPHNGRAARYKDD